MLKELLLLFLIVFAGTGGELCVTRAMKKIGEVKDFRPASLVQTIFRVLGVGWMWLGVALMALAFFFATRDAFARKCELRCAGYGSELRRGCPGRKILSRRARDGTAMGWRFSGLHWRDLRIFQQKIGTQKTSGGKKGLAILLK
jgi:hypothetical protein